MKCRICFECVWLESAPSALRNLVVLLMTDLLRCFDAGFRRIKLLICRFTRKSICWKYYHFVAYVISNVCAPPLLRMSIPFTSCYQQIVFSTFNTNWSNLHTDPSCSPFPLIYSIDVKWIHKLITQKKKQRRKNEDEMWIRMTKKRARTQGNEHTSCSYFCDKNMPLLVQPILASIRFMMEWSGWEYIS